MVKAEVAMQRIDMAKGMMFRESLPEGRGMLFVHPKPDKYSYWMFEVKMPLDIIWMDRSGRVVEMSENTPPCTTPSSQCSTFGGGVESSVVLELPAGYGRRHGVQLGSMIRF